MRALALLLLPACDGKKEDSTQDNATAVTWAQDVSPVIAERCVACHETALAPFPLATWDEVEPYAAWIVSVVDAGLMPPWPFQDDTCREVPGSLGLSAEEKALFAAWREGGYARGDGEGTTAAPASPTAPRPADARFGAELPFEVDPVETDPYWCAYASETFAEEVWIEGAEIALDSSAISHHGFVYAVPEPAQAAFDALDSAEPLPGFRCDGGLAMADGVTLLAGWAPGSPAWWPTAGADGTGVRVPAGSRLAVEMHYNTLALDGVTEDAPAWDLWIAESRPPWTQVTLPVVDLDLAIPAGAEGWTETATTRLPVDALLVGTGPHMHGLGRSVRTTLTRADGETVCLTDLDGWDFNWQFGYPTAAEGIPVSVTDTITLTCTYDNPGPGEVAWGERTDEEMCLDYLTFVVPSDPDGGEGICGDFAPCDARCEDGDAMCSLTCMAHSGEACLTCGTDAMFGDCTTSVCWQPARALGACTRACPDLDSDYADCLYTTCAEAWTDYEACWRESFEDGTCAEDHAACVGLEPLSPG